MEQALLLAVLAQVALTIAVYLALIIAKAKAAKQGEVDESRRMLHADAWPAKVQQINNNLANQFEAPVLFYALCGVLLYSGGTSAISVALAWLFIVCRLGHAINHTGANTQPWRRRFFVYSCLAILALCVDATSAVLMRS